MDTGQPSEDVKLLDNSYYFYVAIVMDDIRTTIIQVKYSYQGNCNVILTLSNKLRYILFNSPLSCNDPISEHKPTAEVHAIDTKFSSFAEMESNNWTLEEQDSIKPQPSRGIKVLIQIIKWLVSLFFIGKTANYSGVNDY